MWNYKLVVEGVPLGHFEHYDDALKAVEIKGKGFVEPRKFEATQ